jgi:hypothetical protein
MNFRVSGLYPSSGVWRNTTFQKLDLFPSSGKRGEEDTYSETDPVSETSCSFEHRTMDKVQKPRNSIVTTLQKLLVKWNVGPLRNVPP